MYTCGVSSLMVWVFGSKVKSKFGSRFWERYEYSGVSTGVRENWGGESGEEVINGRCSCREERGVRWLVVLQ